MTIKDRFQKYVRRLIPLSRGIIYDVRSEPSSLAPTLDVDRLQMIISNAEAGNTSELFAVYRDFIIGDSHSQSEFTKRKLALLGDPHNIVPVDEKNPDDVRAAEFIRKQIDGCDNWYDGISALLDSVLWPVSIAEKVFELSRDASGNYVYRLKAIHQVPYELFDFQTGRLRIKNLTKEGRPDSTTSPVDPNRYVVHRGHLLSMPDNWGGPMRSIVFWWLLGTMDRAWWSQFLERFGTPFLVAKYDQNDDQSRSILERAFSLSRRLGGLVVSRQTDIEIREAIQRGGDGFEKFHTICQREKSKLILGQTLSAEAQATGMNSGVSDIQSDVRQDIRQFDATRLAGSLRQQLFRQMLQINRFPGAVPKLTFGGVSSAEAKAMGTLLVDLSTSGYRVADAGLPLLTEKVGLPIERKPEPAMPSFFSETLSDDSQPKPLDSFEPDRIARTGSAPLSQAFRGRDAVIARIIRDSRSPQECEERVRVYLTGVRPGRTEELIEQALSAYAADGADANDDEI